MPSEDIPTELTDLENRLRARPGQEPTPASRIRIIQAVAAELASDERQSDPWLWPAVAAAVLIVMNLSMISASRGEFSLSPAPDRNQIAAEFQTLGMLEAQQEGISK